jgi:hypothetical protein
MSAQDLRRTVMDAVTLMGCGYVDQDTVTALCPICHGGMSVRFIGDGRARFTCCREGCRESLIVSELLGLDEIDTRDEEITDLRERVDRLAWLVGFLRDLAFESCTFCDDGRVIA